jgi:hypothetical protein
MNLYSIIGDIDISIFEQTTWNILLQKQLNRNMYLFKQYNHDN